jgi:hypothetical protein
MRRCSNEKKPINIVQTQMFIHYKIMLVRRNYSANYYVNSLKGNILYV